MLKSGTHTHVNISKQIAEYVHRSHAHMKSAANPMWKETEEIQSTNRYNNRPIQNQTKNGDEEKSESMSVRGREQKVEGISTLSKSIQTTGHDVNREDRNSRRRKQTAHCMKWKDVVETTTATITQKKKKKSMK